MRTTSSLKRSLSALAILSLLAACGGNGGNGADPSSPSGQTNPPPVADTGTVGIIFTDAPTDDFDQFIATVAAIELLGENGKTTIFSGPPEDVDFLQLESFTELFTVAEDVPAGDYNKIRLILDKLRLVDLDDQGNVIEEIDVQLPGNGKTDLNPKETFFVMPGSTVLIEIDVDANKSLKVTQTGVEDKYQFRPVIFVKISDHLMDDKLARVFGSVYSVNADERSFVLCQDERVSDPDNDEDSDSDSDDGDDDNCLTVKVYDDTGIFGANGDPIDFSMIMKDDLLTAIGSLRVADEATDSDGDSDKDDNSDSDSDSDAGFDDDDLILDAYVIELGDLGSFTRLKGVIDSDFDDATQQFGLEVASGQGFADGTSVAGLVQMGTGIFDTGANHLDSTALQSGRTGHFEGVLRLSNSEPDLLKTSLIVLDPEDTTDDSISGEITMVTPEERSLMLMVDSIERCVDVPEGTDITIVTITDTGSESASAALAELMPGWPAVVFGMEGDGCYVAESIRAEDDQRTGDPTNNVPVADAGPDESVTTGESVMLDGSGSFDDDGDMLTYSWTFDAPMGSSAMLDSSTIANPVFTTDVDGDYVAELIVNDGTVDSMPDSVTVTATSGGGAPPPDGVALYGEFCASCHNPLSNTEVPGATASAIQTAIDEGKGGMDTPALTALTPEEIQAIADALAQ